MSLYINSPSYYTSLYGVDEEIYKMCRLIEKNIDIKKYTSKLDSVGVTPIIVPKEEICDDRWQETKKISLSYRFASISLYIDYSDYISSNVAEKKSLIIKNILDSLLLIKKRLKNDFNYEEIKNDISTLAKSIQ